MSTGGDKKTSTAAPASSGLAGINAGDSAISTVGKGMGLNYRGYDIVDLSKSSTFQEVSYLLLKGKLPTQQQLKEFVIQIVQNRTVPDQLKAVLEKIPKSVHPMDVMRTVSSFLGLIEPETQENDQHKIALRLLAVFPTSLLYWYHFSNSGLRIKSYTGAGDSIAENFLKLMHLTQTVDPLMVRAMDVSLILYAQHEFNASTFAARVTISTLSDFYSGITSAVGTLRGPLHGGANEAVMDYLAVLNSKNDADKFVNDNFAQKQLLMGFGHRVYQIGDPRSDLIKEYSQKLSQSSSQWASKNMYEISEHIEKRIVNEKKIYPNLDFYSASAYSQMGIPIPLFTPIFVCSRVTGWSAHIFEQRSNNQLIRPLSNYTGPSQQAYLPLNQRPQL